MKPVRTTKSKDNLFQIGFTFSLAGKNHVTFLVFNPPIAMSVLEEQLKALNVTIADKALITFMEGASEYQIKNTIRIVMMFTTNVSIGYHPGRTRNHFGRVDVEGKTSLILYEGLIDAPE